MKRHITTFQGALQGEVAGRPVKMGGYGGWGRNRIGPYSPLNTGG